MVKKLRCLALHSFRTSSKIFQEQISRSKLDKKLGDLVELVYLTAPHPASGKVPDDVKMFFPDGPYYEWGAFEQGITEEGRLRGAQESVTYICEYIRNNGPFDGLVGFSQGAVMSGILATMQLAGEILTDIPLFKFVVMFAGGMVRDPFYAKYFDNMPFYLNGVTQVPLPSVQCIGDRDPFKPWCDHYPPLWQNPVVIRHPKGHVIPPLEGEDLQRMRDFLKARMQQSRL